MVVKDMIKAAQTIAQPSVVKNPERWVTCCISEGRALQSFPMA